MDIRKPFLVTGFTLVELLIVLVILGLLAGLTGPQIMGYLGDARSDTARLQINDIAAALDLFYLDTGRYPDSDEGLAALIKPPADVGRWNGPYLRSRAVPLDPWGNPYHYHYPGEHADYDLYSLGADNAPGGEGHNRAIVYQGY